jgi:DNA-binding MarR family transcriptional regulator
MNVKRVRPGKRVPLRDTGQVMRALVRAAHAVEDRCEEALARVELSGPKFIALTALTQAGEPLSLGELAAQLTCVRSNITQLVDRLEADGLVRRVEDPTDRRGKRAAVTPLGAERQSAGARQVEKVKKELGKTLAGLDRDALERVVSALT